MTYVMINIINTCFAGICRKRYKESRHVVLTDSNTLRTCEDIAGLTVRVGAGIKETPEALRTDLLKFFVELKC